MKFNHTNIIQAAVFLVALLLSACGGGGGGGTTTPNNFVTETKSQTVGPAGGTLSLKSNEVQFTITVPAGALAADTNFTVESLPPVGSELARIAISPPGVAFSTPVTVTMTLPSGRTANARQVAALQVGTVKVYVPSKVDTAARTVTTQLSYFGLNGTATPGRVAAPRGQAVSARPAPAPAPSNTLTLEELAILQPQMDTVNQALVSLQFAGRFEDAAALQLSIAALAQSAQVPEWQVDANTFLKQASVTVCAGLDHSIATAQGTTVSGYGDYLRVAKDVVYWEGASQALGAEGCTGNAWSDALHTKLDQALTFVSGKVNPAPSLPSDYGPAAGEISDATRLGNEANLLYVPSVYADTRQLYVDKALQPFRAAAFETSLTSTDQSNYLTLLNAFGPTQSLSDDAQYAATTFTVTTKLANDTVQATKAFGRGATVGTPVRTGTLSTTKDGTIQIAGSIAVLHCPNPAAERLQILFEGVEVGTLDSSADELLSGGHTLPVLQVSALLSAAGIDPAKATKHLLQIKRTGSSCINSFAIYDDVLAAVTLSFSDRKIVYGVEGDSGNNLNQPGPRLGEGIISINADGTGYVQLTYNLVTAYQGYAEGQYYTYYAYGNFDTAPTWSPDGSRIAFMRFSYNVGEAGTYVMNANGSGIAQLTTSNNLNSTNMTNTTPSQPAWSPDGTKIAYVQDDGSISVINALGGSPTQLPSVVSKASISSGTTGTGLAWSPDGTKLAFIGWSDTNYSNFGIHTVNADGSGADTLLITPPDMVEISSSAWSPDGSKIVFWGDFNGSYGIWEINADGSNLQQICNTPYANSEYPSWSPDGGRIAFAGWDGTFSQIFVMNADGSNTTQITNNNDVNKHFIGGLSWR